jgi:alpha-tubulin suppressor-like RCC1 family protein
VSIRDVVCSKSYTLALSEDGKVYAWGRGTHGHLGNGSEQSQTDPGLIKFDFRDEQKKIRQIKKESEGFETLEDLEKLLF